MTITQTSFDRQASVPTAGEGADARASLWLTRLSVTNFRSYERTSLTCDDRPVVLTGANGTGKTNLLEAISFLAPGRGLRRARLSEIDRVDGKGVTPGPWAVAAQVESPEGPRDLGTGRDPAAGAMETGGRDRRLVRIDGQNVRGQQALGEVVSVVWLTPQMDGLFRDGVSGRRRFLDRLVYAYDPVHAGRVSAYEHALRERARLLKSGRGDAAWLTTLEDTMARYGVAIAAARRHLVGRLASVCETVEAPFPRPHLGLAGALEAMLEDRSALEVEDTLRADLAAHRQADAETGGAAIGAHRSDLTVGYGDKNMSAAQCSTGEQKALLVAIVLAHARLLALDRQTTALLLLDEVAAHLDEERRALLLEALVALGAQAWLTGTERSFFEALDRRAQYFRVQPGQIVPD